MGFPGACEAVNAHTDPSCGESGLLPTARKSSTAAVVSCRAVRYKIEILHARSLVRDSNGGGQASRNDMPAKEERGNPHAVL